MTGLVAAGGSAAAMWAAGGWVAGWAVAGRSRRLPRPEGTEAPTYTVVVPARNEARRIPRLLAALARDPRRPDVVVVDDASTDGTAELAAAAGARVVRVDAPPGWTGKAWACWQGAHAATGDVVVFLDADAEPAPGFVARLAAAAAEREGLVSVQPTHVVARAYERASATCNVVALMAGTGASGARRWWRGPVAFGPALAVPRQRYLDAGGHQLVRGAVTEDLALAAAFARLGVPVAAYADAGEGAIVYRMYPEGPRSLVQGWAKNLAAGARSVPALRAAAIALWVAGGLAAAASAVAWVAGRWAAPAAALMYALYAVQHAVLMRRAGRFGAVAAAAYPLPLACFAALAVASAFPRRREWRGRLVPA